MIAACNDTVLVLPPLPETKHQGIEIPEQYRDTFKAFEYGVVQLVGPDVKNKLLKPGMWVVFDRASSTPIFFDATKKDGAFSVLEGGLQLILDDEQAEDWRLKRPPMDSKWNFHAQRS